MKISHISVESDNLIENITVYIAYENTKLVLANLNNNRSTANICLFIQISDGNTLSFVGNTPVRIFGYIEPFKRVKIENILIESSSDEIIPPTKKKYQNAGEFSPEHLT